MSQVTLSSVERLALRLAPEDQAILVEHLARNVRQHRRLNAPADLYGAWKGRFPASFDAEAVIEEIRSAWTKRDEP
jgi:hypothetical protein